MQKSDIAIYDTDIGDDIIELVRRDAEREVRNYNNYDQFKHYLNEGLKVCYLSTQNQEALKHLKDNIDSHIEILDF
jgi:siroheme synthase